MLNFLHELEHQISGLNEHSENEFREDSYRAEEQTIKKVR
jgi:hypothetical protein